MREKSFVGKRALVGGASKGIGRAIAEELARGGAQVCAVSRSEKSLTETLQALDSISTAAGHSVSHEYFCADYANPEDLRAKVAEHISSKGSFDILINNTGGPPPGPLLSASKESLDAALSSHLICNHYLVQACVPGMKEKGWGRIVNIVSTSVREPLAGLGVSNTTRGAVASWAKTLANELGPLGITVNNVLPGPTETGRLQAIFERKAAEHKSSVEAERSAMAGQLPVRRLGRPEEIAYAACFFASPAAGFITGVSLAVDGGRMAGI
jgi:3-oxoacyl-[acyl-carrier protein] reductase